MSLLGFALLLLLTIAWVSLPLLPALRELLQPTDVEPLTMVGRDNADISRFARHFREYAEANLRRLPSETGAGDYFGKLPDGTHFVRVAHLAQVLEQGALPDGSHDRLVVLDQPVTLRGSERFRLELWARGALHGGPRAVYRAVLGEDDIRIGDGSTVLRWIHARGRLEVGDGGTLFGRASSEQEIRLGRDVAFERVGAPAVAAGEPVVLDLPPPDPGDLVRVKGPDNIRQLGDQHRVDGDFWVPPHGLFVGNLVVSGDLRVSPGARLRGNVKAHGAIQVESGAVIEGSLVGRKTIRLEGDSWVRGPVISEDDLSLAPGAKVGLRAVPTTVSGRTVSLGSGATVCGHIVTQEGGLTLP